MTTDESVTSSGNNAKPMLAAVFSRLENYPKSIYIQKFSSTTYTPDCKDIVGEDLPSKFGLVNGINNIWRVKLGRVSSWVYLQTIDEVFAWLDKNCG